MKVVLTGASSFSGLWFAQALAAGGHDVVMPLRATSIDSYSGIRAARVARLQSLGRVVLGMEFGSDAFLAWMHEESTPDIFCHHASFVTGHKDEGFNYEQAFLENVRRFPDLAALLKAGGCKGIVYTGTYYEPDEGVGSILHEAFSPYALSKSLSYSVIRYYAQRNGLPIGKFVMPNPFGPFEEKGFTFAMIQKWLANQTVCVRTPDYVRDNIHVDLLALAYEAFCCRIQTGAKQFLRTAPSGYVESQGEFARRFQREFIGRTGLSCPLEIGSQVDFSEPLVRHNSEPAAPRFPQWSEQTSWDNIIARANWSCSAL